jgi:hypothetical protein
MPPKVDPRKDQPRPGDSKRDYITNDHKKDPPQMNDPKKNPPQVNNTQQINASQMPDQKKDVSTAILDQKKAPNKLLVNRI